MPVKQWNRRSKKDIISGLSTVKEKYEARGFEIINYCGDKKFYIVGLKAELVPAILHI